MTDDLCRLAEAVLDDTDAPADTWYADDFLRLLIDGDGNQWITAADAAYIVACSPDRILALLDRLDALEAVAVAARRFDGPCSPGEAVEGAVDIHNALAAIEGEK